MSAGVTTMRILIWMAFKALNLLYVPLFIVRLFKKSKLLPPIKNDVLLLRASELAEKIRKQELSSEGVIKTYIARIGEVNPIINAVIEDRFDQAIEDAKYADKLVSFGTLSIEELREKYPLLGVPVSIKGSLKVTNMKHTSGLLSRANVVSKRDAVVVKALREAGAIPLLTSNVPELCMHWESYNKIKGRTNNPHSTIRTSGGSSGGEGSLLASACSVIGLGSDVGGSLRLPAHFCGVWSHKPSPGAVSYDGHYPDCKSHEEWTAAFTLGPMTRYATDLGVILNIIMEPSMKDFLVLNEPVNIKDVRVHYIEDIGSLLTNTVSGEIVGAIHKLADHFNSVCFNNCEKIKLPLMKYAPELAGLCLLDIDDVSSIFPGRGEGSYAELFKYLIGRSKSSLNPIMYGVLRRFTGYFPKSVFEDAKKKMQELKGDIVKILGSNGVLIIPTSPLEAAYHGDMVRRCFDASYLWIFNALELPVTTCPVTFTSNGLPIGVQVVGSPNCDRVTLAVAAEIERAFGGWRPPPTGDQ